MWVEQVGLKEAVDGEVFADALKSGSPFLKSELFMWMAEKLKDGKSHLLDCFLHGPALSALDHLS